MVPQSRIIGPACRALIERLFSEQGPGNNLRAAQGVVGLRKTFGANRLEAACERALAYDNPRYRTIKTILDIVIVLRPSWFGRALRASESPQERRSCGLGGWGGSVRQPTRLCGVGGHRTPLEAGYQVDEKVE